MRRAATAARRDRRQLRERSWWSGPRLFVLVDNKTGTADDGCGPTSATSAPGRTPYSPTGNPVGGDRTAEVMGGMRAISRAMAA